MHEITKVAILGAGAIGAYFFEQFSKAGGFNLTVLAGGERYRRLVDNGLVVNGNRLDVHVTHPDHQVPPADLVIVALKHHHLPKAVGDLQNLIGEHTTIMSAMNGLDSEEIIGSVYGMDKILFSTIVGIDAVREGNCIKYTKGGKIYFGADDHYDTGDRVRRVQAVFDRVGFAYEIPDDIMRYIWWKFMINVGVNQASAVMRAPYGKFQTMPEAAGLMESLMREVIVLAQHLGVDLREQDIANWYTFLNTLSPDGKTSMLQDIEAGRKSEVEMLAGKMVELGAQHQIPTLVNQTVLNIIHVLEADLSR